MTTDLAWLAGFFDGECCIVLNEQHNRLASDGLPSIRTIVQVANVSRLNIESAKAYISAIVGREIRYLPKPARARRQATYVLSVTRHDEIRVLLTVLLPYLVGKRPQGELMLRYLDIAPGSSHRYDERHYGMVQQMHRLNARAGSPLLKQEAELSAPIVGEETVQPPV